MDRNKQYGHHEKQRPRGLYGSIATGPSAGLGYALGDYEDIGFSTVTAAEMVTELFDAPYHRIAFLQQGTPRLWLQRSRRTRHSGVWNDSRFRNYRISCRRRVRRAFILEQIASSQIPCASIPVLPTWSDIRFHSSATVVRASQLSVQSATITAADGTDVPCFVNRDANDPEVHGGVIIFPQAPMEPDTKYTVKIKGATVDGNDISRTWSFTTRSKKQVNP